MTTTEAPAPPVTLTMREREILALIADGRSNAAIARRLWLSVDTIKSHNRKTFRKLGARDRAHAVHIAHQKGLLT